MLIDDVTISVKGGDGGRGAVAFSKVKQTQGPTGASGGNGGSVYLEGVSDLGALNQFRYKKDLVAENGEMGDHTLHDGARGEDLIIKVPVGTVVHYLDMVSAPTAEVVTIGQRILVAKGGRGGKGNYLFRSSRNTTPKEFQYGKPGEKHRLRLELKLIADVGFIGFPNAGKTSLLNELTNTDRKVANYPFTTLEPNIGAYYSLILADIPGLIEGASEGKGLGTKFLRHIERTKILFHFVSAESDDPVGDYHTIRRELANYSQTLADKTEYLFLSKSDMVAPEVVQEHLALLRGVNPEAMALSLYDDESLEGVAGLLRAIMSQKEGE